MMGDDLQDLAAIDEVDVFFTTPNALDIVKDNVNYISKSLGVIVQLVKFDLIISSKGSNPSLEFERYIGKR